MVDDTALANGPAFMIGERRRRVGVEVMAGAEMKKKRKGDREHLVSLPRGGGATGAKQLSQAAPGTRKKTPTHPATGGVGGRGKKPLPYECGRERQRHSPERGGGGEGHPSREHEIVSQREGGNANTHRDE